MLCFGILASATSSKFGGGRMARIGNFVITFFTLTEEQRKVVGEKVLEFGNIGGGALIFGSALAEGRIRWIHLVGGFLFWILMFCLYLLLTKSRGEKK
jgi:hypothetical protein